MTPVRVFNTITSQYETLQTYDDHYRLLTETRLHEGAQSGSGDECEGAPQHKCAPHTWFLESAAMDVAAVGYYGLFTGQRAECPSIGMLNKRGDCDYSNHAELLKNGDFHEYKGGRGEFLLIQSYDMFVSTLTQAVVRARTFASGEKMSVFAVATILRQHPKKKDPTGLPWRFR